MTPVAANVLPTGIGQGHRERIFVREINVLGPQTQYLCMEPDGVNCFASAFSLEHLVTAIERREAYERKTVGDYEPALVGLGLTFAKSISGAVVMHEVRDEQGQIMGVADLRSDAVEMALISVLAKRDPTTLTAQEFRKISFCAQVTRMGKSGVVYVGHVGDQPEIAKAAKIVWLLDGAVRAMHPQLKDFVPWFRASVLRTPPVQKMSRVDVTHLVCTINPGQHIHFVFTLDAGLSADRACAFVQHGLTLSKSEQL